MITHSDKLREWVFERLHEGHSPMEIEGWLGDITEEIAIQHPAVAEPLSQHDFDVLEGRVEP